MIMVPGPTDGDDDPDWDELMKSQPGALWVLPDGLEITEPASHTELAGLMATAAQLAVDYTLATCLALMTGDWDPAFTAHTRIHEWITYTVAGADTEADYYQEQP